MSWAFLTFGRGNAKLARQIATFSLPAGHTCPGALQCLARADRVTGKLADGKSAVFRCFAASQEAYQKSTREARWRNFELLRGKPREAMAELISASLPSAEIVRIHVSGDFFSADYFLAWCDVARSHPATRFYAYTKSIHIWNEHQTEVPANLILTASEGGRFDGQINGRKCAKVVFSEEQATALGLALDHDDSHAYEGQESFALLLHGTQRAGSTAAKAWAGLRLAGGGYGRK